MRKFIFSTLCVFFLLCATAFMIGCGKDNGSTTHKHEFTEQIATKNYLVTAATCTAKAKYYYSCNCGEKGTETFEYGNTLGHSFTYYASDNNATCTEDGTKTAKCDRCQETDTIIYVGSKLGHIFTNYFSDNNATYEKDGTKTAHCDNKGCTLTKTITDEGSKLISKMSFKTLLVSNNKVYGKVSNSTETFSFINEIEYSGLIKYFVSLDIYGNEKIETKTIPLKVGDNKVYITELLNGEPKEVYEVTVRRRPKYTIKYNTNGGSAVYSQTVEEDDIIPEPTTTKIGYTFVKWNYDFSQSIAEDTTITASWKPNIDTTYKVEYYFESLENSTYTLYETSNLQGTTDTTATAEIKRYEHFTFNENKSTLRGDILGDGTLILKIYYKRNTYTLLNANPYFGEITNATTKKYGNDKIKSVATEYLGYEFIGWFNEEKLLSKTKEFTFTIEYNVTAKFKVKDEMLNFTFNSSLNTCNLTGIKDKSVSQITIPNYVTSIDHNAFYDCSSLTSIKIPNSVTSIGNSAFSDCTSLTSVTVPDSVISIGNSAFKGCSSLESITLPFIGTNKTANKGYNEVFGYIFGYTISPSDSSVSNATFQYSISSDYYHYYIPSNLRTIILSNNVTSINDNAFYNCSSLASITIGKSVTSIGESAFYGCTNLSSVYYIGTIKQWAEISFDTFFSNPLYYAHNLYINDELVCGINLTTAKISTYAFTGCRSLTSVTIGNNVITIGDFAFDSCSSLTSVTIGNSVTSIGSGAFSGCFKLLEVINNSKLKITKGSKENGNIAYYALNVKNNGISDIINKNDYLFYTHNNINYLLGYIGKNKKLTLPGNCNGEKYEIYKFAFLNCRSLISITIPDSVTSIGSNAFSNCSSLTNITIGKGVINFGNSAFSNCIGLTDITIPNSVTSIGSNTFSGCTLLKMITIPNSVTSIGHSAFYNCSSLESITLPFIGAGITTSGGYDEVFGYIFGYSKTILLDSYISGATYQYNSNGVYYHYYIPKSLKTVILSDSVTIIYDYAFYNCNKLTNVTLSDNIKRVGAYAFKYCNLKTINYTGTKEQWDAIDKGRNWDYNAGNYTINYNYKEEN